MKNTGFYRYVYDFIVDYDAIPVDDILDIHKYLMKKIVWYKMFGFIKKMFVLAMSFFSYKALKYVQWIINSIK